MKTEFIKIDDVIDLCKCYLDNSPIEYSAEEILYDIIDKMKELQETGSC